MQFLYMMADGRYCKIGISTNPERRRKEIWYPSWVSSSIRLAPFPRFWGPWEDAFKAESIIKARLCDRALPRCTEWFRIGEDEMLAVIGDVIERMPGWSKETAYRYFRDLYT